MTTPIDNVLSCYELVELIMSYNDARTAKLLNSIIKITSDHQIEYDNLVRSMIALEKHNELKQIYKEYNYAMLYNSIDRGLSLETYKCLIKLFHNNDTMSTEETEECNQIFEEVIHQIRLRLLDKILNSLVKELTSLKPEIRTFLTQVDDAMFIRLFKWLNGSNGPIRESTIDGYLGELFERNQKYTSMNTPFFNVTINRATNEIKFFHFPWYITGYSFMIQ